MTEIPEIDELRSCYNVLRTGQIDTDFFTQTDYYWQQLTILILKRTLIGMFILKQAMMELAWL